MGGIGMENKDTFYKHTASVNEAVKAKAAFQFLQYAINAGWRVELTGDSEVGFEGLIKPPNVYLDAYPMIPTYSDTKYTTSLVKLLTETANLIFAYNKMCVNKAYDQREEADLLLKLVADNQFEGLVEYNNEFRK